MFYEKLTSNCDLYSYFFIRFQWKNLVRITTRYSHHFGVHSPGPLGNARFFFNWVVCISMRVSAILGGPHFVSISRCKFERWRMRPAVEANNLLWMTSCFNFLHRNCNLSVNVHARGKRCIACHKNTSLINNIQNFIL